MIKETSKKLYAFEKIVLAYAMLTHIYFWVFHFKINYMIEYFFFQVFGALAIGFLMVAIYFIFLVARSMDLKKSADLIKARYFNPYFFIDSLRIITAVVITIIFFCNLKQIIPLVNLDLYDPLFWKLDALIHFNVSPTLLALKLPKDSWLWAFMDKFYVTFFLKNIILPWVFILQVKSVTLRNQLITSLCLIWILGGLSYFLFPAIGPCYFKPILFEGINIPIAKNLQKILFIEYSSVINNMRHSTATLYGIAAMPSLHIAVSALFTIFSKKLNRMLFILVLIYAILIWIGSIMLGWHYAIDGYVEILVAILAYFIARYLVPQKG